jgi:rhodanese-related sulfurtransferase
MEFDNVDTASISVSPSDLAARLARDDAPLVLDVRREVRFAESAHILPRAQRCDPDDVAALAASQSPREAVVYCVHGLEIGRQAAETLQAAGWNARFLEGGIEGWIEAGLPTAPKDVTA